MAVVEGDNGIIKYGSNEVKKITEFSINTEIDLIAVNTMGQEFEEVVPSTKRASGSITCLFDADDTGQSNLTLGSAVDLELYPNTDTSGSQQIDVSARIASISRTVPNQGLVEVQFDWQSNGTFTVTTAS